MTRSEGVEWRSTQTWRFCHSHWHQSSWRRPCTPRQCSGGGPMPSWISLEVRLWVCWERERESEIFIFCLITCVCENLDYESMVMGSIFYYFLWFWIDFVWFGAHQLSVKLARPTRCELCDAISYIGLLWFLRIWFKLFLILKNFDGLYICNFFFFFYFENLRFFFRLCF